MSPFRLYDLCNNHIIAITINELYPNKPNEAFSKLLTMSRDSHEGMPSSVGNRRQRGYGGATIRKHSIDVVIGGHSAHEIRRVDDECPHEAI